MKHIQQLGSLIRIRQNNDQIHLIAAMLLCQTHIQYLNLHTLQALLQILQGLLILVNHKGQLLLI